MDDKYVVEKNIPLNIAVYQQYPFGKMEIGDSFKIDSSSSVQGVRTAIAKYKKRHPAFNFRTKKIKQDEFRCWRIPCTKPLGENNEDSAKR